jgi:hypothetical protein
MFSLFLLLTITASNSSLLVTIPNNSISGTDEVSELLRKSNLLLEECNTKDGKIFCPHSHLG